MEPISLATWTETYEAQSHFFELETGRHVSIRKKRNKQYVFHFSIKERALKGETRTFTVMSRL